MRRALVALVICLSAIVGPAAHVHAATVLFHDDFNGTSVSSVWERSWFAGNAISKPVNGAEESCFDPQLATVSGGALHLAAKAQSCTVAGHTYSYRSALVNTRNSFHFTTGTLRARVWLPGGTTLEDWPSVWSDGASWPNDGEIDAFEALDGKGCYHVHDRNGGPGGCVSMTGGWHTLKMRRTNTTATFWYDHVKVGSLDASSFAGKPHYAILQLALSSSISPPVVVPREVKVDWISVSSL